jgi:hypothetical protein
MQLRHLITINIVCQAIQRASSFAFTIDSVIVLSVIFTVNL